MFGKKSTTLILKFYYKIIVNNELNASMWQPISMPYTDSICAMNSINLCRVSVSSSQWIQCSICYKWMHSECAGLAISNLPTFLCCTKIAPKDDFR